MASFRISDAVMDKLKECKPRKVSASRNYPRGCGRKSGETSKGEDVDAEAVHNGSLELQNAVLPGCETELVDSVGGEKLNATGKDVNSGAATVAMISIPSERNSGNKVKVDFTADYVYKGETKKVNVTLPRLGPNNHNSGGARSRVRDTLLLFHCICRKLSENTEPKRVDLVAAKIIKDEGKDVNTEKQFLGEVPRVEVGDEFQYRTELAVVGVHRPYQAGIDSMEHEGKRLATSIVASGSYTDNTEHADVLTYSGHGGNMAKPNKQEEKFKDQQLKGGNLALSNSNKMKNSVRVVRGWEQRADPYDSESKLVPVYFYDGLYTVTDQRHELHKEKLMHKFELTRKTGQPKLDWQKLKKDCISDVRHGVCTFDITDGKETFPVCAVNGLDDEQRPDFIYISKMMYPNWYCPSPPTVCTCGDSCENFEKCECTIRNGGKIPYTRDGRIVETKPIVYECGPECKCQPRYSKVTQQGIKVRLETFKTDRRGWGLRALTSIRYGTFICEYVGELLEHKEAEKRIGKDEYLFDIGQSGVDSSTNYKDNEVAEENRYTIHASRFGNLGRFINHSCSPNLYAQKVIYDDDKMPHVMFFAAENIPPFKELTYNYNYKVNQVLDSNGNIKIKKCFCGSADCSGRMY